MYFLLISLLVRFDKYCLNEIGDYCPEEFQQIKSFNDIVNLNSSSTIHILINNTGTSSELINVTNFPIEVLRFIGAPGSILNINFSTSIGKFPKNIDIKNLLINQTVSNNMISDHQLFLKLRNCTFVNDKQPIERISIHSLMSHYTAVRNVSHIYSDYLLLEGEIPSGIHLELHPRMLSFRNFLVDNENLKIVHDCIQNVITLSNNENSNIIITDSSFRYVNIEIQHSNVTFDIQNKSKNNNLPPIYRISNSNVELISDTYEKLSNSDIVAEIEIMKSEITFTPKSGNNYFPVNITLSNSSIYSNGELKLHKLSLYNPRTIDGNIVCYTLGIKYNNNNFSSVTAAFDVKNLELYKPTGKLPLKINISDSISVYNDFHAEIVNPVFLNPNIDVCIYLDEYSLLDESKLIISNVHNITKVQFKAIYNGTSYLKKEQAEKILPGTTRTLVQFEGDDLKPIIFTYVIQDSNLSKYINLNETLDFKMSHDNSVIMVYRKTPSSTTQILCYATNRLLCNGMTLLRPNMQKAPDYVDRIVLNVIEGFPSDFYLNFNLTDQPVDFVIEGNPGKVQVVNINLTSDTRYMLKSLEFKAVIAKFRFDTSDKSVNLKKLIVDENTLFMPSEIYNFDKCDLIVCHISAVRLFQTNLPKFEVNLVPNIELLLYETYVEFHLNNQLITSIQNKKLNNYTFNMADESNTFIKELFEHHGSDIFLHLVGQKPIVNFRTYVPNNESKEYIEISDGTEITIDTIGFAPIRINNFTSVIVDSPYTSDLVQISSLICRDLTCNIYNIFSSSAFFQNVLMEGNAKLIGNKTDINVVILSLQVNEKSKAEISNVQLVNSVDILADSYIVLGDVQIGNTKFHVHPHVGDQNYQIYVNSATFSKMSPLELNVSFIEEEDQYINYTKIVKGQHELADSWKNINFSPDNSNYTAQFINDNHELIINCSTNANGEDSKSNKLMTVICIVIGVGLMILVACVATYFLCVRKLNRSSMDASSLIEDPIDN